MTTVIEWLRKCLDRQCGLDQPITLEQVREHVKSRRSEQFETERNNRIAMGFLRYESIRGRAPDYLRRAKVCLDLYEKTGNLEFLVDVANFVEFEYQNPSLPNTYFQCVDGHRDGHHDSQK